MPISLGQFLSNKPTADFFSVITIPADFTAELNRAQRHPEGPGVVGDGAHFVFFGIATQQLFVEHLDFLVRFGDPIEAEQLDLRVSVTT